MTVAFIKNNVYFTWKKQTTTALIRVLTQISFNFQLNTYKTTYLFIPCGLNYFESIHNLRHTYTMRKM